ncbi:MAG: ATP-binding cassette domain-containing protein [Deltaproteobacteria bacterium]|jgi:ABC-type nitrate/sulfonate/bicarbonate transport system ATPase subunit|nr:ATP-binding cassette domain-containing protein [Deltaproteobacteria bacterium]
MTAPEGQPVLLELSGVSKSFGDLPVIAEANLKARGGRVLCLLGPSGVGKTTLLEIMAGLLRPDSGQVTANAPPSMLFQDNLLIPWLNALSNVAYILPKSLTPDEAKNRALRWLGAFGLDPAKYPRALSGGMKRRLALARALAADRPVLILDEPFAFLDDRWHELIATLVAEQAQSGHAVVISGHFVPERLSALLPDRLDLIAVPSQPIGVSLP